MTLKFGILPSEFVTCFWLTATLTVYGREIFIYTDLTLLRMENVQFNIFKPKTEAGYQIKKIGRQSQAVQDPVT